MANPTRFVVSIVDPVKSRRDEAERVLKIRFDPMTFATAGEARTSAATRAPHAIVLTMRQTEGNGLVAAKELRKAVGDKVLLIVTGPLDRPVSNAQRAEISRRHDVDTWVTRSIDIPTLEVVLWNELLRRFLPREGRAGAPRLTLRERIALIRARVSSITRADVKAFLFREYHIIPTPPRDPDEEPGWIELLNSPPTLANVKKLLTKDLTPRRKMVVPLPAVGTEPPR